MSEQMILAQITKEDLLGEIRSIIRETLKETTIESIAVMEWLTGPETQRILKISAVTLWKWDKKGITKPHTLNGNRKRYRKEEILQVMKKKNYPK